jgi:hypothetical protein
MPLQYKPIADIQFKTTPTLDGLMAYTPKEGEPVFVTGLGNLYVGDGTTAGGILLNTDSTTSIHILATETNMGSYHQFSGNVKAGMFLRAGVSGTNIGDAAAGQGYMKYLDFYDLKEDQRRHNIEEHGGQQYSIFFTDDSPYIIDGTTIANFQSFDTTTNTYSGTASSYRMKSLSYDGTAMLADMNGTESTYALTVSTDISGNPVLDWRRLDEDIVDFGSVNHDILSHSSSEVNHLVYVDDDGVVLPLSLTGSSPGDVLRINNSGELDFSQVGYADITGAFELNAYHAKKYIGRMLVKDISTNAPYGPWSTARWFYGNPSSGLNYPKQTEMDTGGTMLWIYGFPQNNAGQYPASTGASPTGSSPYYSSSHLKLSSHNTNSPAGVDSDRTEEYQWGDVTGINHSDHISNARVTLESLNASFIRFRTKQYTHTIGLYNVLDSESSSYNKAFDKKFVLYLAGPVPGGVSEYYGQDYSTAKYSPLSIFTRTHVNFVSGGEATNVYATASSEPADFEFDTFGMFHIKSSRFDETNAGYSSYVQEKPVAMINAIDCTGGVYYKAANDLNRPVNGLYINFVEKVSTIEAFTATETNVRGIHIENVKHNKISDSNPTTNGLAGRAAGLEVTNVDSDARAYGIYYSTVNSDSDTPSGVAAGGLFISTIKATRSNATGLRFNDVSGYGFSRGIQLVKTVSETKYAAGIAIQDYSSALSSCSSYGLWISGDSTSNPTDWTSGGSGTKYAIVTENAAGPILFQNNLSVTEDLTVGSLAAVGDNTYSNYNDSTFFSTVLFEDELTLESTLTLTGNSSSIEIEASTSPKSFLNVAAGDTSTNFTATISGQIKFNEAQVSYSILEIEHDDAAWVSTNELQLESDQGGVLVIDPAQFLTNYSPSRAIVKITPATGHTIQEGTRLIIIGTYDGHSVSNSYDNMTFETPGGGDSASYDLRLNGTWDPHAGNVLELVLVNITCSSGSDRLRWIETNRIENAYTPLTN